MAEPEESFKKIHLRPSPGLKSPIRPNPRKSYSVFLCKSLFFTLILVAIPLFPSQAPGFIDQTVLTKLWELLHLLFIGIAVSYGLFGRKKSGTENEVETQSKSVEIQSKSDNLQTYLSGFLHFPSVFEDGIENPYGSDEKRQIQTWNSQYFQGEPMVFASQENCVLEDLGKPKSVMDHKPLSLPIRSLRSKTTDRDAPESVKRNESTSDSDKIKNGKFRGLIPINLEEKFKETVSIPSPVPWGSKSRRMEVRENMNSTSKSHSHSKHISNGESEFDYLKSEAFWSPIFSQTSSMPSQEIRDSKMEDVERGKSSCRSASKLRNGFSIGSFSEMKCDGNLKEFSRSMREDLLGVDSRKIEVKVKSLRRGKSVRTIRVSENRVFEGRTMGETCSDHVEDSEGKTYRDEFDDFSLNESSKLSEQKNEKVQDFADSNGVEDEKDSESESEKFELIEEVDAFKVDKKAGEFIAKFRERIRLQKIAANKGFSGW
ncbi:uncharacterized protein LOC130781479 [Actinidia eriantha]|uniref:uncharacterized protein LOC130781479 n=1 Tax=Actinidia eriantha TaxID=165200 RepID=UPI00258EB2B3|nr:uncharacterized protein LOC130781479 [Actinidia eriantha]